MKFKDFIKYIEESHKTVDALEGSDSLESIQKRENLRHKTNQVKNILFDNIFSKATINDIFVNYAPALKDDKMGFFLETFTRALTNHIPMNDVKGKYGAFFKSAFSEDAPVGERLSSLESVCLDFAKDNKENEKNIMLSFTFAQRKIYTSFNSIPDFKDFFDTNKFLKDDVLDSCVPTDKEFETAMDNPALEDQYIANDKIQELKQANNDPEILNVLDDANEILKHAKSEYCSVSLKVSESYGQVKDEQRVGIIANQLQASGFKEKEVIKTRRHVYVNKDENNPSNSKEKVYKTLKGDIKPAQEQRDQLKEICKILKEKGIFTPGTFQSESGSKRYAFSKLTNLKNELDKAVKENNIENIKKYQKDYRDLEKVYDDVLNRLNNISQSNEITSNLSPAREPDVPTKYRNDVIGASRLSALWLSMGFFYTNNIDMEDAIDDPIKAMDTAATNLFASKSALNGSIKENYDDLGKVIAEIDKGPMGMFYKEAAKDSNNCGGYDRAFDAIATCLNQENKIQLYGEFSKLQSSSIEATSDIIVPGVNSGLGNNKEEYIKNMVFCKKEDFHFQLLNPDLKEYYNPETKKVEKGFDRMAYFEKNKNIYEVITNLTGLQDFKKQKRGSLNETINNVIKSSAKDLLKSTHEMSFAENRILKNLKKGIQASPTDITLLKIEHGKLDFTKEADVKEALDAYSYMQKDYNRRNFLSKWILPSTKSLKEMSKLLKDHLNRNGISNERINSHLASYEFKENKENKLGEVVKKEPVVNNHREPIIIENKEFENNNNQVKIDNEVVNENVLNNEKSQEIDIH